MPGFEQQNENIEPITTGRFYVRPVSTSVGTGLETEENIDSTAMGQFSSRSADTTTGATFGKNGNGSTAQSQTQDQQTSKSTNNGLTKALVGGLIGATLGTLAAALANKRTSQGVNHAARGVGQAAKTVGEGVNHAAKGVGQAVKAVTEGVNYAVVGGVAEAVKNTAENAKQAVAGAADAVKDSVQGSKEAASGEAGIGMQAEVPPTAYILVPVEKEKIIERTIIIEPEMPVAPDEANLGSEEVPQMGLNQDLEPGGVSQVQVDEQKSSEFQ